MTPVHIHIVGLGVTEELALSRKALAALTTSDMIVGWKRHKAIVEPYINGDTFTEVKTLNDLTMLVNDMQGAELLPQSQIAQSQTVQKEADSSTYFNSKKKDGCIKKIAILASGDPLYFGIGKWLQKHFSLDQLHFHPAVSSIQAACHKQGLSLQDVNVISLHGRPVVTIRTQLKRNATLVILTDVHSQPKVLAQECVSAGFADSVITVHEALGYDKEKSSTFNALTLSQEDHEFDALHVSVIQVQGPGGVLPEFPGIPDTFYHTGHAVPGKGMITKREVRLAIVSFMQPAKHDVIWDIGAGCGGVAVELSYWNQQLDVYAVEYHPERLVSLKHNQQRFGVTQNLHIIEGKAPDICPTLPRPNKIFIGGSGGALADILELAWATLPAGGLLVASSVTETTKAILSEFAMAVCGMQKAGIKKAQDKWAEGLAEGTVESVEVSIKRGMWQDHIADHSSTSHHPVSDETARHEAIPYEAIPYEKKLPVEIFKFFKRERVS